MHELLHPTAFFFLLHQTKWTVKTETVKKVCVVSFRLEQNKHACCILQVETFPVIWHDYLICVRLSPSLHTAGESPVYNSMSLPLASFRKRERVLWGRREEMRLSSTSGAISGYFLPLLFPRHLGRPPSTLWHQNPLPSSKLQYTDNTRFYIRNVFRLFTAIVLINRVSWTVGLTREPGCNLRWAWPPETAGCCPSPGRG